MITDWDQAYDNRGHIGHDLAEAFFERAAVQAAGFRQDMTAKGRARTDLAYGDAPRQTLDLFMPEGQPKGLAMYVHGGFWRAYDKSYWSHFMAGPVARGWAVAVPSYTLAPEIRVSQITQEIVRAIAFAADEVQGALRLAGHSAGGHLVSRMICRDIELAPEVASRIEHVVSISGVHDLRPMLKLELNQTFGFDAEEAAAESPVLKEPVEGASLTCWVGGAELPEFLRQNDLLANVWTGLGASTRSVHAPGKNHLTVLEELAEAGSGLAQEIAP